MPPTTAQAAGDDHRLKRHIGTVGLLFTAVGSIIGSGWLFGAMNAAQQAGPASIISWLVGAVMILLIGLTYAELGTMFPVSGGVVRFPHFAFGSFASYISGWITWIATVAVAPLEVLAVLQYAANYIPWLQTLKDGSPVLTTPGLGVACALLFCFVLINMLGVRWFARINNTLVVWKVGIIIIAIVAFLVVQFHPRHFFAPQLGGFMPMGWHGVFSAVATAGVVFSYLGFRQGVELAGETSNPQRNVPIAILGSLALCTVIYVGLQVAFIGALPESALSGGWANIGTGFIAGIGEHSMAFGPLAALAAALGLSWLAILLYVDAFVSPSDTGLIYTILSARLTYAMGRNGNAPKALSRVNDKGVPWVSVLLAFFVGLLFFLPFPGWQKLVGFHTSAMVMSFGSGPLTMMALRRELPDHKRPFRLGGGWIIPYLAFLSSNLIVFWSGWDVVWKLMVAVLLGFVLLAIHETGWGRHTPKLDLRAGFWMLPWLGGVTLISWLGRYPGLDKHAGNLGYLDMVSGLVVIVIFSAAIMALAQALRLRGERVLGQLAARQSGAE
ncbi:MAG TPA: APC family permease [Rhodanobacteraceae bacterium]|nr:APC family permease [Rhodanobacteraceae bacterium]